MLTFVCKSNEGDGSGDVRCSNSNNDDDGSNNINNYDNSCTLF